MTKKIPHVIHTIDVNDPVAPEQMLAAYTTTGIAYFTGLPVAEESVQHQILSTAKRFFHDFSQTEKDRFTFGVPGYIRGYSGIGSEQYSNDPDANVEHYVESLDIVNGMTDEHWPSPLKDAGIKTELEAYLALTSEAAVIILSLIEKALDLKAGFLTNKHQLSVSNNLLRLNHYPSMTASKHNGHVRFGEHTDFDTISVVMPLDAAEGFQIKDTAGQWRSLKRKPGTILVHVADMLSRWSNDRLIATPHRVQANPTITQWPERYSLILFAAPATHTVVNAKDLYPDEPSKCPPITAGDYLKMRLEAVYGKDMLKTL